MTFEANQSKSMVYTVPKLYSNSYSLYDCVICILYPFSLRRGKILVFSKVTYTACEQALLWWWWAGGEELLTPQNLQEPLWEIKMRNT